jgi:hypothetical protein
MITTTTTTTTTITTKGDVSDAVDGGIFSRRQRFVLERDSSI